MCVLAGELERWPSMSRMADILRGAGLRIGVGRYAIRVRDCDHFVFQQYGGDLGEPQIDADGDTLDQLLKDARLVSAALARADLKHRFEVYDDDHNMVAYVHHRWPLDGPAPDAVT